MNLHSLSSIKIRLEQKSPSFSLMVNYANGYSGYMITYGKNKV
jgi:hypothetical protein